MGRSANDIASRVLFNSVMNVMITLVSVCLFTVIDGALRWAILATVPLSVGAAIHSYVTWTKIRRHHSDS